LADKHFKVVWYESDSTKVFPNVDIKGGVAVTFRDRKQVFEEIGVFSSFPELGTIANKVKADPKFTPLSDIIYSQNRFKLEVLFKDYPEYKNIIGSNGTEKRLTTSIFEQLGVFKEEAENETDIKILGLINNSRIFRFLPSKYIENQDILKKYKVLLPKSNGSGQLGESLSTPIVGRPNLGFTQSFIGIGNFENIKEANACLNYLYTKFLRAMLGILKVTQDNSSNVWQFVPLQDFTSQSDIDWKKSIHEIDQQLYKKYQLSEDEIAFIERTVKPMGE
jgi:hypothetical protein